MVVVVPGSPLHAAETTQMADAPASPAPTPTTALQHAAAPGTPQTQEPSQPAEQRAAATPIVDSRAQTAARSAPLPLPEPPLASASLTGLGTPSIAGNITHTGPENTPVQTQQQPAPPAQAAPTLATATPTAAQPPMPAPYPVPGSQAPAAPPPTPAVAPAAPVQAPAPVPLTPPPPAPQAPAASPAPAGPPPPGVGVPTGTGVYGGSIHVGGLETIPLLAPGQPAGEAPPAPPAPAVAPQVPQASSSLPEFTPPASQAPPVAPAAPVPAAPPYAHPVPPAPAAAPAGTTPEDPGKVVVYTDAEGNPVPPPPDPLLLMPEIAEHAKAGQFQDALDKATLLLEQGILNAEQREELLHVRAEMLFAVNKDQLAPHYNEISDATNQAINFNQKSPRNAAALLRLGYMNLKLNNIPEAEARFNMLRRLYPNDENVPLTYYYWGDFHFGRNELQRAADEFQYVLQEYPNSRYAREAALGLARSFYRMGYYEQSFNVVDYIERRWERFYVQYPPFLNMMGDVAFRLNKLDYALDHYWLYVNLEPKGEETDIILTRIGDIYSMQREKSAAKELYTESMQRFQDKDGGLVAMMRLAEEGVNDSPTIAGMFSIFDGPFNLRPVEVYRSIINKHPGSALVPLAELKLAMWHLWNKEYTEVLDLLSSLVQKYPQHELVPKAKELALQTFAVIAAESMQEERYARMRELWEKYPLVRGQAEAMSPESRIALGVSYRHDGNPNEALKIVEPFFLGNKVPEYSELALSLVLSIYLEYDQWPSIREVAKRVDLWELTPESRQQLDYALALAAENLGETDKAAPIWQKLYDSGKLPQAQMAYAAFFLARDAERQRELEKAFFLGSEALSRLITQVERNPNAADVGKIQTQLASLMDVSETAGRLRDALGFAEQYLQYLPAEDPERTAVRYRMARIYRKQGDVESWKKLLGEIASQSPDSVYGRLAVSELNAASIAEDAARYSPTGRL